MSLEIKTFGCRLNILETEKIRDLLSDVPDSDKMTIFHSCAITGEAERQLQQALRKYHREHPERKVVLTGCAGQLNPKKYDSMPEISKVIGNTHKFNKAAYASDDSLVWSSLLGKNKMPQEKAEAQNFPAHTKAFIQIQQGCDHFCTYCIVPTTRGRSYNFPKSAILKDIKKYLAMGYKELTLTGADIASYKNPADESQDLSDLIQDILKIDGDYRIRLSSYDPAISADSIFNIMAKDHRLCPFLHISMQSGQDDVLEKMRRRHMQRDIQNLIKSGEKRVPDLLFGADIITGFPTETEAQFEETYEFVKRMKTLVHLHVFPYSPRAGTAAYTWKSDRTCAKSRAKRLRDLKLSNQKDSFKPYLNKSVDVLSEGDNGYTGNYIKVAFSGPRPKGEMVSIVPIRLAEEKGEIILFET
ncbi:MAG: tRNA (N(6)-L-threonylcarbamoyladenosine(37)-C(2))-methylthiotransferase MtaB [Alphaproteobacteria bacterium]|nr:tRNA (N(6)-L-threonylcarbamoyladenosine(37)-C(2))-methylthiotransferase MtaB [Alphaproteobacteria bacterium]